jgi:hypothetical protein
VQDEQLATRRAPLDERASCVSRVVHLVDLLVGEIVQRGRCDVAGGERDRREEVARAELERALACRAEEHEQRHHRGDAVAQHHDVESRELRHFGVTTLSGQIDVSTST